MVLFLYCPRSIRCLHRGIKENLLGKFQKILTLLFLSTLFCLPSFVVYMCVCVCVFFLSETNDFLACPLRHRSSKGSEELMGWPMENVPSMVVRVRNHPFRHLCPRKFSLVLIPTVLLLGSSLSKSLAQMPFGGSIPSPLKFVLPFLPRAPSF